MKYGKRKQTRKQKKTRRTVRIARKRKTLRRFRQSGGAFSIPSISKENEDRTIVTVRPDSREPDSIPMTGTLTQMRKLLEDADVGEA